MSDHTASATAGSGDGVPWDGKETDTGQLWRSDDGGASWRVVNWSRELIGRAGYYIHLAVSPANEDEILISNSSFFQSVDGGQTFRSVSWGGDNHDIWWDPKDADRFAITHDAGITITTQHGRSTQRVLMCSIGPSVDGSTNRSVISGRT